MLHESFVCPPRAGCPFYMTAKRYWLPEFVTNSNPNDALTLLFLHSTSFHKETWEPTLHSIFQRAIQPGSRLKLREAWLLDCPSHGEAAVYNERVLRQGEHAQHFTCQKYASAVHSFLTAGTNEGARRDFTSCRLIGIGHSLGANTILLLQQYEPRLPFLSLVIVEPMVSPDGPEHLDDLGRKLVIHASRRRDVWKSREEARAYFLQRVGHWDKRVVNLFVEFGLRVHPGGVTLACAREQEAAMYRDKEGVTKPVEALTEVCSRLPIHLILGRKNDYVPLKVHEALLDPRSGRRYASIKYIDNVGHLIPQKKPDELAPAIWSTLPQSLKQSKL